MFNNHLKISLCRTCLRNLTETGAFNIFTTLDLTKKLILCSALPVEASDGYPENVCKQCYGQILLFYEFQQMCSESLEKFNDLIKSEVKDELEQENFLQEVAGEAKDPLKEDKEECKTLEGEVAKHLDTIEVLNEGKEKNKRNRLPKKKIAPENKIEVSNSSSTDKNLMDSDKFEEKDEILLEEANVSNEDTIECSHQCHSCSACFKTLQRLETHKRQHEGLSFYTCNIKGCQRKFNRWKLFDKHQEEQHKEQRDVFKCDVLNCERTYTNKSALNVHKRRTHNFGPVLKAHMCEICGKVFKSSAHLIYHQYTHIDRTQLPYACEEEGCSKRFSNKEKLKIHKMRHAGIKNFICPHCGTRKTTRNELKIHINYHTRERTWSCTFCPKVCNSAGNLKMHVRNIHEGVKDFACRFCERTFAKADTKKYHEMTHTGEKPHECEECGRKFVQPAALRTHRKIHLRQEVIVKEKETAIEAKEVFNSTKIVAQKGLLSDNIVAEILSDNLE